MKLKLVRLIRMGQEGRRGAECAQIINLEQACKLPENGFVCVCLAGDDGCLEPRPRAKGRARTFQEHHSLHITCTQTISISLSQPFSVLL